MGKGIGVARILYGGLHFFPKKLTTFFSLLLLWLGDALRVLGVHLHIFL